ncbi:MAG: uroporphyrinogen-III synthase [Bauldia sp.]
MADWRQAPMFVTGDATARAAAALGFTDVRPGGGDAASLAETVREALPAAAGAVLYPAARERTGRLSEELIAAGYEVRLVEAYRAAPVAQLDGPVRVALANGALDGVLLYSRRTAEAFRVVATKAGIADRLEALTYYVLSEQIGAALAGIEAEIRWPERPDEASLLGLIGPPG